MMIIFPVFQQILTFYTWIYVFYYGIPVILPYIGELLEHPRDSDGDQEYVFDKYIVNGVILPDEYRNKKIEKVVKRI